MTSSLAVLCVPCESPSRPYWLDQEKPRVSVVPHKFYANVNLIIVDRSNAQSRIASNMLFWAMYHANHVETSACPDSRRFHADLEVWCTTELQKARKSNGGRSNG